MSMINEQIKELRKFAKYWEYSVPPKLVTQIFCEAANTIEKLYERVNESNNIIEKMAEEIENCYGRETELTEEARKFVSDMSNI